MAASSESVRLPSGIDTLVGADVSLEVLTQKIQSVSAPLPSLLPRNWIPPLECASSLNEDGPAFRVMQFNMLAEGLSMGGNFKPPFATQSDGSPLSESSYGGFSEVHKPEVCFDFVEVRRWRLLEEILRVDADIIALEEIDHFSDFFEPALKKCGYEGVFVPKASSPCCQFGYFSDGVALFWRTTKFRPFVSPPLPSDSKEENSSPSNHITLAQTPSPVVVSALEHISSSQVFVVGVTHLKAKPGNTNEERRKNQIDSVLNMMDKVAQSLQKVDRPGLMLLGDFNTDSFDVKEEPKKKKRNLSIFSDDGVDVTAVASSVEDETQPISQIIAAQAVPHVVGWNGGELLSAYPLMTEEGSAFTTWKKRGSHEVQHTIDYIFYSGQSFQVHKILDAPEVDVIPPSRFPCLEYPSDHLSIAVDFSFV